VLAAHPGLRRGSATFAGVAAPAAFIGAWVGSGAAADGYSPVHDAISELARVGASTRPWMTGGLVAFGVGLPVFAAGLRRAVAGPAWMAATAAGLSSLAVAAIPLRSGEDVPGHAVAAAGAYLTLAAVPLLAARPLARMGRRRWARASVGVGAIAGVLLAGTAAGPAHGLLQRMGLTLLDAWVVAAALTLVRSVPAVDQPGSGAAQPAHPLVPG
jgi:hypothetical membrane protein